jgi:UDP-glucose 4-epimerase
VLSDFPQNYSILKYSRSQISEVGVAELALVTGGAGFIGSHLVDELVRRGNRVRVFDDFSTGLRSNLDHLAGKVEVVEGSLTDPAAVEAAAKGAAVVFHLGALASVARSVEAPLVSHAACATGTLAVLDAARRHGARRVVYAASSSCYGGGSDGPDDKQTEGQPLAARSPYAAAKLAGELYLQAFHATYGLETVRLRFFNIFGPRQRADSPYSGVIAIFAAGMKRGERPTVHGDGLQSRDFTFVSNAVQALVKASESPKAAGNVYNVGTGASVTLLDLVRELNAILGTKLEPTFGPVRAGDVRYSRADISRAKADLGYDPGVTFAEGLKRTVTA